MNRKTGDFLESIVTALIMMVCFPLGILAILFCISMLGASINGIFK